MPNSLIINGNTVINSSLDHVGRIATFSTAVNVGNTAITPTSITVQSLVVGSISTSGAGGSSTGFNITGNGSFTGALSAGSLSTLGTFSAGNTVFNGTVTLGNIGLQNGSITVGNTTINSNGLTNQGVSFGYLATTGYYFDGTNLALRPPVNTGTVFFQTPGGASSFATFSPSSAAIFTPLAVTGNIAITAGSGSIITNGGTITTDSSAQGGVRLMNGGTTNSGYIEFRSANTAANRLGYIGFAPTAGGAINIATEAGSYYNFTGAGTAPQIGGSPIVSNATLASQLGGYVQTGTLANYATTAQLSGYATTAQLSGYAPVNNPTHNGNVTINNGGLIIGASSPYMDLVYSGVLRARWQVDGSGNLIYRNGDNGSNFFYISTNGAIWTAQFGDLNNRIESRASAFAENARATAYNQCASSVRMYYAGDLGNDWNIQSGFQSPYNGTACIVDRATGFGNSSDQLVQVLRWRQIQFYCPNAGGWVNVYAIS
ncbi:MAG: hypothetical protein EOO61_03610 [Hymenobacter sp.]|nr:MAG: hypothetical protein EOO61_03610 [Hymenobacter sp.]